MSKLSSEEFLGILHGYQGKRSALGVDTVLAMDKLGMGWTKIDILATLIWKGRPFTSRGIHEFT